jgi:signal peptidase I
MKEQGKEKGLLREWGHAIVFAVIAATLIRTFFFEAYTIPTPSMEKTLLVGDYLFVSKVAYGPKLPETPIAMPFIHHTLPFTEGTPAYLTWWKLPYLRLPGFGKVKRFDPVVFNFPDGDTVLIRQQNPGFSQIARSQAYNLFRENFTRDQENQVKNFLLQNEPYAVRPTDKKENYIKSCVGLPGENLQVKEGLVYINGKQVDTPEFLQYGYDLVPKGNWNTDYMKKTFGISLRFDGEPTGSDTVYNYAMTPATAKKLQESGMVSSITRKNSPAGEFDPQRNIFPNDVNYRWSADNYGPIHIPAKGEKVVLTLQTLPFYEKAIRDYEHNTLEVRGSDIIVNGQKAGTYTFKQNYYFMMGDNRHRSADSRFWGYVPEDHIVGKAVFIWFSKDPETGIRWNRLFSLVK